MRDEPDFDPSTIQPLPFSILDDDPRPIPQHDLSLDEVLEAIQELPSEEWSDFGLDREADYSAGANQESLGLVGPDWLSRSGSISASPLPPISFSPDGIVAAITNWQSGLEAFSDSLKTL